VARKLSRVLRVHFRRLRIATIGPDLSHRRTLLNQVLNSDPVRRRSGATARSTSGRSHKSVAKARRYANEIAANYSYTTVRVMERLLTWLWNRLYDGVEVGGIERLKAVAAGNEVIYVPATAATSTTCCCPTSSTATAWCRRTSRPASTSTCR
jgi:glycerol-3-phosphate O-acyltransferase